MVAGAATVGYQQSHLLNAGALDFHSVIANLGLVYKPIEGMELGLMAERSPVASFEVANPYYVAQGIGGSVRQHLFRRDSVYFEAVRLSRDYAQFVSANAPASRLAGTDVVYQYFAAIELRTVKRAKVNLTAQYTQQMSDRSVSRDYRGLRFGTSVSFGRFMIGNRQGGLGSGSVGSDSIGSGIGSSTIGSSK